MKEPKDYNELQKVKSYVMKENRKYSIERRPDCIKGNNFVTPDIIGYYEYEGRYIEISCGTGIFTSYLFGITLWDIETGEKMDNESTCVRDPEELIIDNMFERI